jgi:hypothetical protein
MPTHKDQAHLYAQDTVAKTVLAAAQAKRTTARGRRTPVRWMTRRPRATAPGWGQAALATWAGHGCRVLTTMRGAP